MATFPHTHEILISSVNTSLSDFSKKPNKASEFSVL